MNNLDILRKCVVLRGGEEFWMEVGKADVLSHSIQNNTAPRFIKFEEDMFNVADISGIFTPAKMKERSMLKRGYWKCKSAGVWHERFEHCDCELSLGNKILRKGSFENWLTTQKEGLKQEMRETNKEIERYKESYGQGYPNNEPWVRRQIEQLNQQKAAGCNHFKNLLSYFEENPSKAQEILYPLTEAQIEEFKKVLREELRFMLSISVAELVKTFDALLMLGMKIKSSGIN